MWVGSVVEGSCLAISAPCSKDSMRSAKGTGGGASDAKLFIFFLTFP